MLHCKTGKHFWRSEIEFSVLTIQHSPESYKGEGLVTSLWSHGVVKVL